MEENRCEVEEDIETREPEFVSAEHIIENQNSGAKSLEIPFETLTEQLQADNSFDIPFSSYSNMSYDEFERYQQEKIESLEKFFRD